MNICFDFDGPIIDVVDRYYRAYVESLQGFDIDSNQILPKEYFWDLKRNRITDIEIGVMSNLTLKEAKKSADKRRILTNKTEYLSLDKIHNDVFDTLNLLRKKEISFFLVTLRTKQQLNFALKQHKLNKFFTDAQLFYLDADDEFQGDIHQKYTSFFQAINQLSINPHDTWVVGDTETEFYAAKLAKYGKVIMMTRGMRSKEQLTLLRPDHIVNNLTECLSLIMTRV